MSKEEEPFDIIQTVALLLVFGGILATGGTLIGYIAGKLNIVPSSITFSAVVLGAGLLTWTASRQEKSQALALQVKLDDESSEYFQRLVNINVENLSAYYFTVKSHANKSFLASLFVGIAGFVMIGFGISKTLSGSNNSIALATLSGLSGVITEFISAVFFYLYNRTVIQMKEYHDSLLAVQNVLLSFKLVGDTSNETQKAKMMGEMLRYLVRPTLTSSASHPKVTSTPSRRGAPSTVSKTAKHEVAEVV